MVLLEKLSNNNLTKFKDLSFEKLKTDTYDKNFFQYYESESFFSKILLKRFVKLFVYNHKIIGYMWYNIPFENPVKVWSIYVEPQYIELLDDEILSDFDNVTLFYEEAKGNYNNVLLNKLGFDERRNSYLMSKNLKKSFELNTPVVDEACILNTIKNKYGQRGDKFNISFKKFVIGNDEKLRCDLQNAIFADKERIEIEVEDIENDIKQDYYIDDLSFFLIINDIAVGYGQVIYNRDMYTVVNFGIIKEFRKHGLGKILLNYIINQCREKEISDLYIRVNENNAPAFNLYKSIGFEYKFTISNWQRNRK